MFPATIFPSRSTTTMTSRSSAAPVPIPESLFPSCPKCGGRMRDNRALRRSVEAPDFACYTCDGGIWPRPRGARGLVTTPPVRAVDANAFPQVLRDEQDDGLPF